MTRQQIIENIRKKQSFLCVGLDTDIKKIPSHLLQCDDPVFEFNKAIIDATAEYCIAYKPNIAFYESNGICGWQALEKTIKYIQQNYPDQLIIADAKRGDIGNTSAMYARTFFEHLNVDAVTVAPYMGEDSVSPFLGYEGKSSKSAKLLLLLFTYILRINKDRCGLNRDRESAGLGGMHNNIRQVGTARFIRFYDGHTSHIIMQ